MTPDKISLLLRLVLAQGTSTPAQMPLRGKPYSICLHSDLPLAVERLKE